MLFAQVISNNGAAISVTTGIVVNSRDAENTSGGILSNNGTLNLSGDYTSTATTGGNGTFRIGRNWTNSGGLFIPGVSTVIFNGIDNQLITRTSGETFYNLSIENTGASTGKLVGLSNVVTVTNSLSLQTGNVNTSTFKLLLSNQQPASLNYTSTTGSRIFGKFERGVGYTGDYLFPLGTSLYYNPANLIINSTPSAGTIISEFITSPPPGNLGLPLPDLSVDPHVEVDSAYVDGFWRLTAANGFSSGDYNINLNGTGFQDTIRDITRVIKRVAGGSWTIADGIHVDATGDVVSRINYAGSISIAGEEFALGKANPLIIIHPLDTIVCENAYPSFSVTATGAEPLTYLWYKQPGILITNGPHYSGARTNTLTILGAVLADAGDYYCVVRDRYRNTTTTLSANLIVSKIPKATATNNLQPHECSGVPFEDIVLGLSYYDIGTTFVWERDKPAGISTLVPESGTETNIGDALTGSFINTTDSPISVTFTITPVGPAPRFCTGIPITATVVVNPTPRVIPVMSEICFNTNTSISLVSPSTMTMADAIRFDYNITATETPAVLIGNRTAANNVEYGSVLAYPYKNTSINLQSVYYNVTPVTTPALGCPAGIEETFEVKAHPKTIQYNYPTTNGTGILITKPLTCNISSGLASLKVVLTLGSDPYDVWWTGPVEYENDSVEITNLNSGKYTVTVTDNIGCSNDTSINIVPFTARPQILPIPVLPNLHVTCPGGNDGSIRVYVSSGITAPYLFWVIKDEVDTLYTGVFTGNYNPVNPNTYKLYNNLEAGNYMLIIQDVNGCIVPKYAELKEPAPITVSFQKSNYNGLDVTCRGYSNGFVVATPSGGNGSYSYQWSAASGPLSVSTTSNLLDSISAGKYYLITTDFTGCQSLDSITLIDPDGMAEAGSILSQSAGGTNISCNGGSDGSIDINITGGSGTYTYSWTKLPSATVIATTKSISGLTAGDYQCIVQDVNGCILSPVPSFNLTEPPPLAITSTTSVAPFGPYQINCYGGTGSIDISPAGGIAGTYVYTWSTSNGSGLVAGQEDQSSLTAGTYHLIISDANGCTAETDITLSQPPQLSMVLTPKHISCFPAGFANGEINLTVSGGMGPYTYLWSNNAVSEDISGLTEGYYSVDVLDANGCPLTDGVQINLPPPLEYNKALSNFNTYNISCNGQSDGWIEIDPISGVAPFIYNWTTPDGTASTKNISDLKAGQYNLVLTDSNYCTASETFNLTEPGTLGMVINLSTSNSGAYNINCAGDSTGFIDIEPVNQVNSVQYLWDDGLFGKTRMNLPAGEYHVIIIDENHCSTSSVIDLTEPDTMKLEFSTTQPFCPDMPNGAISLDVTGGVIGTDYFYKWSDNSTGNNVSNILSGKYIVTVTDLNGCSLRDSVLIEPLNETCLAIPNAISPNDDLINDLWNIGNIDLYPKMVIKIFNRWGETIWVSESGYPQPWNGKSNGKNLPIDSYHYIIDLHNGTKPLVGNITIVR